MRVGAQFGSVLRRMNAAFAGLRADMPAPVLVLAALGVVFGDIGTSPLYALRECFASHALDPSATNVLGCVSMIFWVTLLLIVSVKYVCIVMRADNRGEGGELALMTLVSNTCRAGLSPRFRSLIPVLGILGGSFLFSDGIITPAISVLSAVEGLEVAAPALERFVVPLAVGILVLLFCAQSRGTARMGAWFGPILLVWFLVIGLLGIRGVLQYPGILRALNPWYAIVFVVHNGWNTLAVFGSLFLAVTGAEVLYADLGHFGRRSITMAWYLVVLPGLVLNYFGQGAHLLTTQSDSVGNLFFLLAPTWGLYPLIVLASVATVIASQAVIAGAFSVARQSVQLGLWPRLAIRHTSTDRVGQVYVPFINWSLLVGVVLLIVVFRDSSRLAAAYGIAVSASMLITTLLILVIARHKWKLPLGLVLPGAVVFLGVDSMFFLANVMKIFSGGWIVVVIAGLIFMLMITWREGRRLLHAEMLSFSIALEDFVRDLSGKSVLRVPGVAVFLTGNPSGVPLALLHSLKHSKVLHERTVVLTVETADEPLVPVEDRVKTASLGAGMYTIRLKYGFSETPDIPKALANIHDFGFKFDLMQTSFFLGRQVLIVGNRHRMFRWRKRLFWFMAHNAQNATSFFHLPPNRVVELGAQVEL